MAATALSVLLLTTACSPGTDNDKNEGTGKKDVATGGKAFATADEETAKLGSDADPGAFPRSIEHANGTTDIAEKPQRVVVLDTGELDDVLSLGITPVGMVTTEGANPVPSYLAEKAHLEAVSTPVPNTIQRSGVCSLGRDHSRVMPRGGGHRRYPRQQSLGLLSNISCAGAC